MAKAGLKTKPTGQSVADLVSEIQYEGKRADAQRLLRLFGHATGAEPEVWNGGIIGYGDVTLKYESGREVDFFKVGFAARKAKHSIYLTCSLDDFDEELSRLGKWKRGAGCLYVNKLADIDEGVLEAMVAKAWKAS